MARENRTGVFELPQDPQLEDIFKVWLRRSRLGIRTNLPGTVQVYDPATQKATVRVDFVEILKAVSPPPAPPASPQQDPNLLNLEQRKTPPLLLTTIPVIFPRGSTGHLEFPIQPGATGILHVMDRGIQTWLQSPKDQAVDPVQSATHALQDAVFVPGLHPDRDPITPPTDLTATVLHDDNLIKLGRAALLGVARLTDKTVPDVSMTTWEIQVTTALIAIAGVLNAAVGPVFSAPGTVPVFPVAPPSDLGIINTASSKVSSE